MSHVIREQVVDRLKDERGVTLADVLVSSALLGIAVAMVLSALNFGVFGVESSRGASTAVFLGEQKLEQIRAFVVSTSTSPAQGFANLTSTSFPAEGYGNISGYSSFRRSVAITANAGGNADLQLVAVTVYYKPVTFQGIGSETSVTLNTLVARR